jgi:hypothetical protein
MADGIDGIVDAGWAVRFIADHAQQIAHFPQLAYCAAAVALPEYRQKQYVLCDCAGGVLMGAPDGRARECEKARVLLADARDCAMDGNHKHALRCIAAMVKLVYRLK